MLFELEGDQQLWQDTVRGAVGKHCAPTLARSVGEDGADKIHLGITSPFGDVEQSGLGRRNGEEGSRNISRVKLMGSQLKDTQ